MLDIVSKATYSLALANRSNYLGPQLNDAAANTKAISENITLTNGNQYFNTTTNKLRITTNGVWGDYDATAQVYTTIATSQAAIAQAAVLGLPYFPIINASTAAGGSNILPQGITTGTVGGTAVTGATIGTYALTATGGSFTGVAANLVVTSATAATIVVTNPGRTTSASPTAPTWANPSGATIPGGTTLTANIGTQIGNGTGQYYLTSDATGSNLLYWQNTGTGVPVAVLNGASAQVSYPLSASVAAALTALYGVKLIYGRGQNTPNMFMQSYGNVGKFVQSNGTLGTSASFAATDDMPVLAGNSYVFSRRPEQLAFKDSTGTFVPGSYSAPATGGVFQGTIVGNQLTITSVTAGSLAVGTPIDVRQGTPGGVSIQSQTSGTAGGVGVYVLTQTFAQPVNGATIYGGYKVTAPTGAATMQASMTNTQPTFGYLLWGIYPGTALPAVRLAGSYLDPAAGNRADITASRAVVRSMVPQGQQLFNQYDPTVATGYYWANGALLANSAFFATGLIGVDPGQTYTCDHSSGGSQQGQYFDETSAFVGTFAITANTPFVIPVGVFFIAFSGSGAGWLNLKLVAGSSVPAGTLNFLSPTTLDARVTTLEGASLAPRIAAEIVNLFDKDSAFYGYAISNLGIRYQSLPSTANYVASPNIPVTAGSPIWVGNLCAYPVASGGLQRIAFLNAAGALVGSWTGNVPDGTFTPPATATQMILDVPNPRWVESLMVINGSSPPPGYRPYKLTSDKPKQNAQIILLGDSFTDVVATAGGWVPYFVRTTGSFIVANNALAGRATRDALKDPSGNALTAASFVAATDVIIELGTNDYGGSRALGTIADASSSYAGAGSFYNDVYTVLNTLYGWASSTTATMLRVAWVTPTIRGVVTSISGQPVYPAANSAGAYLTDYIAAIKAVCALFGTPVIDMFSNSGVNLTNLGTMTIDGLHPSDPIGRQNYGRTGGRLWNAI